MVYFTFYDRQTLFSCVSGRRDWVWAWWAGPSACQELDLSHWGVI